MAPAQHPEPAAAPAPAFTSHEAPSPFVEEEDGIFEVVE